MKYYLKVLDIRGNVRESILMDEYPREVVRLKELAHFAMNVDDGILDMPLVRKVVYNLDNVISIDICEREVKE